MIFSEKFINKDKKFVKNYICSVKPKHGST